MIGVFFRYLKANFLMGLVFALIKTWSRLDGIDSSNLTAVNKRVILKRLTFVSKNGCLYKKINIYSY